MCRPFLDVIDSATITAYIPKVWTKSSLREDWVTIFLVLISLLSSTPTFLSGYSVSLALPVRGAWSTESSSSAFSDFYFSWWNKLLFRGWSLILQPAFHQTGSYQLFQLFYHLPLRPHCPGGSALFTLTTATASWLASLLDSSIIVFFQSHFTIVFFSPQITDLMLFPCLKILSGFP